MELPANLQLLKSLHFFSFGELLGEEAYKFESTLLFVIFLIVGNKLANSQVFYSLWCPFKTISKAESGYALELLPERGLIIDRSFYFRVSTHFNKVIKFKDNIYSQKKYLWNVTGNK